MLYEVITLASHSKNICVVGDDDQSIYSWRGADIRNILNFEKDYERARIITLEENYRSTKGRITSYNVCYTKLLRIPLSVSSPDTVTLPPGVL